MFMQVSVNGVLIPLKADSEGRLILSPEPSLTTVFTCQGVPNGQTLDFIIPLSGIATGSVYAFAVTGAPTGLIATAEVAQNNGVPVANFITVRVHNTTGVNSGQFVLTVQAVKS
jgi:hypothetical protein